MRGTFLGGRLSIQNIFLLVASLIATTLLTLVAPTTPVAAVPNFDATWKDNYIDYQGKVHIGPSKLVEDRAANFDLPVDTTYYVDAKYTPVRGSKTYTVIYFEPGTTPETATSAQYVTYKRSNTTGDLSDKSAPKTITLDAASAPTPTTTPGAGGKGPSSCEIRSIGWFICPMTTFIAEGMDKIFEILEGFVAVAPLSTSTDAPMHRAWDIMRNFANVAFVIAFLFIIFSQLTSTGISNYGIKKLLPRIIIAAILVNISYWVCVIAIDLSNILGNSLQGVFIGLRNMVGIYNDNPPTWQDMTLLILSGGALGGLSVAAFITTSAAIASVGGLSLLLLPILVGAATTLLIVVLILAARQAIITILVIIAPLAFIAYLLPNTEKWFEKWRGLFMTMLIFFPAFSVVFGGSQFAGAMIINAAGSDIVMALLGMAVQIAPLAITPLLLKLSGTLLSRIGGLVNDPTKGLKDRTKNWSKDRLDTRRAIQMARNRQLARTGRLGRHNIVRRSALNSDTMRRSRDARKKASETQADSLFNQTDAGKNLDTLQRSVEREKQTVQQVLDKEWNIKAKIDPSSLDSEIKLRVTADQASVAKAELDSIYAEVKAGNRENVADVLGVPVSGGPLLNNPTTARRLEMLNQAADATSHLAVEAMRKTAAEQEQKGNLSEQLEVNKHLINGKRIRDYAGGIQGEAGAQRALASAYSTTLAAAEENIKNASAIISHGNPEDADVTQLISTEIGKVDAKTGIKVTEDIRIAAIRKIGGGKNADEIVKMVRYADIPNMSQSERQEMGDVLLANSATPKWLGAGAKAAIKQGAVNADGDGRINDWIVSTIRDNKLSSAETLVGQDKTYIAEVTRTLSDPASRARIDPEHLQKLKEEMFTTLLHDSRYSGRIGERDSYFEDLYNEIGSGISGGPDTYADAKITPPTP